MKFNIKFSNNATYAEVGQKNPLRWKTLLLNADGSFTDQSGWIKCKDFFNDTVAYFKEGSKFSIWSYKNDIQKNDEGVYFLLNFIEDFDLFDKNMYVVNKQLKADLGCEMKFWAVDGEPKQVVLLMPNELWETTYRISLACMVVRCSNYKDIQFDSWEQLWKEAYPKTGEHAFSPEAVKQVAQLGFHVPDKFKDYWYFAGTNYNSKVNPKATGSIIHNNGVTNWTMFIAKGV